MTEEQRWAYWGAGIGAGIGLAISSTTRQDHIENALLGAASGFALVYLLQVALVAIPMPLMHGLPGGSSSWPRGSRMPLLSLRLSGGRARGMVDGGLLLGISPGYRLSYMKVW
jgi:hypothetical protein